MREGEQRGMGSLGGRTRLQARRLRPWRGSHSWHSGLAVQQKGTSTNQGRLFTEEALTHAERLGGDRVLGRQHLDRQALPERASQCATKLAGRTPGSAANAAASPRVEVLEEAPQVHGGELQRGVLLFLPPLVPRSMRVTADS